MSRIVFVVSPLHTKTPGNLSSSTLYSSCALCLHHLFRTNLLLRTLAECAIFLHFMPLKFTEKKKKNDKKKKKNYIYKMESQVKSRSFYSNCIVEYALENCAVRIRSCQFSANKHLSSGDLTSFFFLSLSLSSKLNTNCKRQNKKKFMNLL